MRFCCFILSKKIFKNCWMSSRHIPLPNAHWMALCDRLRNLVRSEIWSCACVFRTTLLLPSTATHAGWISKCCCHQRKKQKTPACIKKIQVHKLWTKVYSQKRLTAELLNKRGVPSGLALVSSTGDAVMTNAGLRFTHKRGWQLSY